MNHEELKKELRNRFRSMTKEEFKQTFEELGAIVSEGEGKVIYSEENLYEDSNGDLHTGNFDINISKMVDYGKYSLNYSKKFKVNEEKREFSYDILVA
ncbi:hypothetical protein [Oceanobacillus sp. 1P07AA]|uniref:hypothetical protein n=1 Tax=Oceanobacillus sp. 1P07AA TaxID=3132293 RepID=UPI0039A71836